MIEALISLLVVLLIALVVWWVIRIVATHFGLPAVAVQVAGAVIALIFLLYALKVMGIRIP
jgi:hypothetical protein